MRYFLDTEYSDEGRRLDLVLLAVVCEDGREYDAASSDLIGSTVTPWVAEHVLPKLPPAGDSRWRDRRQIRDGLESFVRGDEIEFWSMCAWVDRSLVVRLFGRLDDLPPTWPMACWDLWQLERELGPTRADRPPAPAGAHDALVDARYHRTLDDNLRR